MQRAGHITPQPNVARVQSDTPAGGHDSTTAEFPDVVRALADGLHGLAAVWYDLSAPERRVAARLLAEFGEDVGPILARVREVTR